MTPFGRRRRTQDTDPAPAQTAAPADEAASAEEREPTRGPWDVDEVPELGARLDLGALRVPGRQGMQLRMEMERDGSRVIAANVALEGSAIQLQAFAAPRTSGIWDELRAEIARSITSQGGTADDVPGPFGRELLARLPVRTPDGAPGHRPARFIGVDGPRWFLRAVVTGRAAVDPESAVGVEAVIADVVVVRGPEARAPRELLPLQLPGQPGATGPAVAEGPASAPPTRGPEITEVGG